MCEHARIYIQAYVPTYVHIDWFHISVQIHSTLTQICTYTCACKYLCVCVYLLVFLYVHICAYAHIRMGCVLVKEHSVWSSQMHIKQSTYTHASSMYYKLWKQMHYFNILRLVDKGRIHRWFWWHHVIFLCERYIAMCMSYNVNIKVYVTCMQHTCMHMFVF